MLPIHAHVRAGVVRQLVPLAEAVVQVVGEPAVGKTWLCNRVFRGKANSPGNPQRRAGKHREETQSYEIMQLDELMDVGGIPVTAHVRDFGGPHILHGVHELCLNARCLYLLVVDATRDQRSNRLHYWLKLIRHMRGRTRPTR